MKQYLNLLQNVVDNGAWQNNRTGIRTKMIPGAMMQFDLALGFPATTTKQLAFKSVKGELLGFARNYTSAAQFRDLGCKVWDQNANENEAWLDNPYRTGPDDLGYIYSRLWNEMPHDSQAFAGTWNQITKLLDDIKANPESRRLIVSAWHPEVFNQAALPPCHVLFQVIIEQATNKMHMTMYQRSCDVFLGVPFNIASYSMLLHMVCKKTGYTPGTFTWFGADVHIYENHMEQVAIQLQREPLELPLLELNYDSSLDFSAIEPDSIQLVNYKCHPPLKAAMAV